MGEMIKINGRWVPLDAARGHGLVDDEMVEQARALGWVCSTPEEMVAKMFRERLT